MLLYYILALCYDMKKKPFNLNLSLCRLILEREGPRSLFRGLGPNLVGVAPSRFVQQYLQHSLGRVLRMSSPAYHNLHDLFKQYGENVPLEAKRKRTENTCISDSQHSRVGHHNHHCYQHKHGFGQ